jgi:hypothetical protein
MVIDVRFQTSDTAYSTEPLASDVRVSFEFVLWHRSAWLDLQSIAQAAADDVAHLAFAQPAQFELAAPIVGVVNDLADLMRTLTTSATDTFGQSADRLVDTLGFMVENNEDSVKHLLDNTRYDSRHDARR